MMQFNLNVKDTWFQHFAYNLNGAINHAHLGNLIFCIQLLLLLVLAVFLLLIAYFSDAIKANDQINVKTSFLKSIKNIASNKHKTNIFGVFSAAMLVIILFSIILTTIPIYGHAMNNIIDGSLVYDHPFGERSNTDALHFDEDKENQLLLDYNDVSIPIANATRTFNTLTLKPVSKTGQAYIRVLKYIKAHKKDMYNVNVNVNLDKTTLTYNDINGKHMVACYANNKNKTTNNQTVLHY